MGSSQDDVPFISTLHLLTGVPVLAVDYRFAPEYTLQSGALLENANKVISQYLHGTLGVPFDKMNVTGCSNLIFSKEYTIEREDGYWDSSQSVYDKVHYMQ